MSSATLVSISLIICLIDLIPNNLRMSNIFTKITMSINGLPLDRICLRQVHIQSLNLISHRLYVINDY